MVNFVPKINPLNLVNQVSSSIDSYSIYFSRELVPFIYTPNDNADDDDNTNVVPLTITIVRTPFFLIFHLYFLIINLNINTS